MTKEEAIAKLKNFAEHAYPNEEFLMAIKALEQEPCEDAISRQAAIDAMCDLHITDRDVLGLPFEECFDNDRANGKLLMLPSVTPAEKVGRWITQCNLAHQKEYYYCSECREEYSYDGETGIKMNDYKYCPNCGAKMQEVDE